jgi:hypothetical protein
MRSKIRAIRYSLGTLLELHPRVMHGTLKREDLMRSNLLREARFVLKFSRGQLQEQCEFPYHAGAKKCVLNNWCWGSSSVLKDPLMQYQNGKEMRKLTFRTKQQSSTLLPRQIGSNVF